MEKVLFKEQDEISIKLDVKCNHQQILLLSNNQYRTIYLENVRLIKMILFMNAREIYIENLDLILFMLKRWDAFFERDEKLGF